MPSAGGRLTGMAEMLCAAATAWLAFNLGSRCNIYGGGTSVATSVNDAFATLQYAEITVDCTVAALELVA